MKRKCEESLLQARGTASAKASKQVAQCIKEQEKGLGGLSEFRVMAGVSRSL